MLLVCVLTPYTCFAPSIHIMVLLLLLLLLCSLCFEQTQQHQSFLHSSLIHLFRPTQRTLPPRESSPLSRASPFLSQFPLVACLLFFLLLPPPPLFRARSNHTHFSLPSIPPSHFFFCLCCLCSVAEVFEKLSYGPAPESPATVNAWLDDHGRDFGHFINNKVWGTSETERHRETARGETCTNAHTHAYTALRLRLWCGWCMCSGSSGTAAASTSAAARPGMNSSPLQQRETTKTSMLPCVCDLPCLRAHSPAVFASLTHSPTHKTPDCR